MGLIAPRIRAHLHKHAALVQLIGVVMCLPPLLFPWRMPAWAIWLSLVGLTLLLVLGQLFAGRPFVRTPLDISILLFLLLLPVTLLITPDRSLTLLQVYKIIGSVALFYGVIGFLDEKPWFGPSAIVISTIALGLAGLILLGTDWSTTKFPWFPIDVYQLFPRAVRAFWNPEGFNSNIAGGTLAMLLPVPMAYLFFGRSRSTRLVALLVVATVALVLLLTQSRGAIAALLAGIAVMVVAHDRRWLLPGMLLIILGVVAVNVGRVENVTETDPIAAAGNIVHSAQGRIELWSRGLMMLQDFPLTGIGLGLVVEVMPLLYPTFLVPNDAGIEHVHNLYLEAGVDLGYPGLILTLAFLFGMLYIVWQAARRARGGVAEPFASAMLGTVVVYAVHGLVDNLTFYAKAHLIAWALFGVAVAVALQFLPTRSAGTAAPLSRKP